MVLLRFCTPDVRWGSLKAQPLSGYSCEPHHLNPCVSSPGALRTSSKARLATLRNGLWAFRQRTSRFSCSAALNEGKQQNVEVEGGDVSDGVVDVTTTSEPEVVEDWGADPPQKDWDGEIVNPKKKRGILAGIIGVFVLIGGTLAAIQAIGAYKASDSYKTQPPVPPPVSTERDTSQDEQSQADKTAGAVVADEIDNVGATTAAGAWAIQPDETSVELPGQIPVQNLKKVEQSDLTSARGQGAASMERGLEVAVSENEKIELDSAASDFLSTSDAGEIVASVFTDEAKDIGGAEITEKVDAPILLEATKAAETIEAVGASVAAKAATAVEAIKSATNPSEAAEAVEALELAVEAEVAKALEAVKAVEATKEAEIAEAVEAIKADANKAVEATKVAATEAVEAIKAETANAVEAVNAVEDTDVVEAFKAETAKAVVATKGLVPTDAVEAAKDESTLAVEAMRAEAAKAEEAVRALEEQAKIGPVATVGAAKELVQAEEDLDLELPSQAPIVIAGAVSEEQVAEIASGKSVDDLRQRAMLAARASTVASEAARRAAAYATASSRAASDAAFAAERGASATGAALAAMELGAEEAIVEVGQDTSEMEAERRAMKAAELAAESERRAAQAAGLASAHSDVADRQAEIAEELSSLHKSKTSEMVEQARNTVTAFWVETKDFAIEAATMIKQWVINLAHGLSEFWPALVEKCENGERKLVASFNNFWASIGTYSGSVAGALQNQFSSVGDFMRELAANLTSFSKNLVSTIGAALGKSAESIRYLYDNIVMFFKGFVENFK